MDLDALDRKLNEVAFQAELFVAVLGASSYAYVEAIASQSIPHWVAAHINCFELLGGVSFDKGCYTGQEVVARMQHLGKLKRRMFLANVAAAAAAGDELCSEDLGDQASGMVVNSEASPDGGHDLLAVVQTASREGSTVHLKSLAGPVLRFLPLPYAIA